VLKLINNSLINGGGTNSSNFTMILSFISQKRILFKTRKSPGFPGFPFSATRNPGFKILPRIGNTTVPPVMLENNSVYLKSSL